MRLGIIGLGNIWEWQKRALDLIEGIEIVAVCDIDEKKGDYLNQDGIRFYLDYKTMINNEIIDSVLISTPPASHYEIIKYILMNNIHVLVEKPITLNINKMNDLYQMKKECSKLITAFHAAFAEDVIWFKNNYLNSMIEECGEIINIESCFYDPYVINSNIVKKAVPLSGSWIDSGVNALSVIGQIIDLDRIDRVTVMKNMDRTENIDTFAIGKFNFLSIDESTSYSGCIKTDWTIYKNHKSTTITFKNLTKIVLNHSEQSVDKIINGERHRVFESAKYERLQQHYINLFNDFRNHIFQNTDNREFTEKVHKLLLECIGDGSDCI